MRLQNLKTLRGKFLFVILPPVVAAFVFFSVAFAFFSYLDMKADLEKKMSDYADTQANLLSHLLWGMDFFSVETQIESLLAIPDICGSKLEEFSAGYLSVKGDFPSSESDDDYLVVARNIVFQTPTGVRTIGRLTISSRTDQIYKSLTRTFLRDSLLLLLLVSAIISSAIVANKLAIGIPLEKFLQAIRHTEISNERKPVEWESTDELGRVISAYNRLLAHLTDSERQRLKYTENLQSAKKEMEIAKQGAEKANQAKSVFLANMSHEIRTPMNAIVGMCHLIVKTGLTVRQQDYVDKIRSSARTLVKIIDDILDFTKIDAGMLVMESSDFFFDDMLENLTNLVGFRAEEKGLRLFYKIAGDVPYALVGDSLRLGQVLTNLAVNAVKFTDAGEIVISTTRVSTDSDTVTLGFSVKDPGIGLTMEQIGKLFRPFSQADNSTTRKYGGTGLGLTICKRLVTLMGGNIFVESELGKGSVFRFDAQFGMSSANADLFDPRRMGIRDIRILAIDGSAVSREILKMTLESFSFGVVTAESAESGLSELEKSIAIKPYDLILTDWTLPDMTCIRMFEKMMWNSELTKIPILAMIPGTGRSESVHQARLAGLRHFVRKPTTRTSLFKAIANVFSAGDHPGESDEDDGDFRSERNMEGAKALLVEDNTINQQVASELLESLGISVTVANNGLEGSEIAKKTTFDVILMDIQMPEMDGFQATRAIRAFEAIRGADPVPIIAMTAHAMDSDRQKSLDSGMNDHITKPIDPNELFATVEKWAARNKSPHESGQRPSLAKRRNDLPRDLPGIDMKDGLKRVLGNRRLYRDLLVQFRDDYGEMAEKIRTHLNGNDPEAARKLAHRLKGVSGNIGAVDVFSASDRLVQSLTGDKTFDKQRLADELCDSMNRLRKSLGILK